MDIIDNLIYASYASPVFSGYPVRVPLDGLATPAVPANRIISDNIPAFPDAPITTVPGAAFTYPLGIKMNYCSYNDPNLIENAVYRHWYDIDNRANYDSLGLVNNGGAVNGVRLTSFEKSSTYHLLGAYLLENTRILQIFERLIEKYITDEDLGIATDGRVLTWIQNSEQLFFKNDSRVSANIRSLIRPSSDSTRRNAYWRLFGMDLAFGDINSVSSSVPYVKAKTTNLQFIPLFEKYLAEIWQGYINARNSAGENRSDVNVIVDLSRQLRELLIARRGDVTGLSYSNLNLSREEFSAMLVTSWFTFIVTDNTPVVEHLNCQSSTVGERLLKIGAKVGVPAHSKCQYLFEMAGPITGIMTTLELGGFLDDSATIQTILSALNPPPATPPAPVFVNAMTDFLTIINNWEKATGHKIKSPEANIIGTVRVQSNGVKAKPALN